MPVTPTVGVKATSDRMATKPARIMPVAWFGRFAVRTAVLTRVRTGVVVSGQMPNDWKKLRDELFAADPGMVARVDQAAAEMRAEYDRYRWRVARAVDHLRPALRAALAELRGRI